MAPRPGLNIDLGQTSFHQAHRGSPSPRRDFLAPTQAGDVPPPLSPLDAFALQGRILAQRLEESQQLDHRISRLPANAIAKELARPRVNYFHGRLSSSLTEAKSEQKMPTSVNLKTPPDTTQETMSKAHRPRSYYPVIQTFDDTSSILSQESEQWGEEELTGPVDVGEDYFTVAQSATAEKLVEPTRGRPLSKSAENQLTQPTLMQHGNGSSNTAVVFADAKSITYETSQFSPDCLRSASTQFAIRPVRKLSRDDEDAHFMHKVVIDPYRSERNPSSSSNLNIPRSPFSPVFAPPRSPSMSSEYSLGQNNMDPKPMNFSRPLSRNDRPSCEPKPPIETTNGSMRSGSPHTRSFWEGQTIKDRVNGSTLCGSSDSQPLGSAPDHVDKSGSPHSKLFHSASPTVHSVLPRGRSLNTSGQSIEALVEVVRPHTAKGPTKSKLSQQPFEPHGLGLSNMNTIPPKPELPYSDRHMHTRSRSADSSAPKGIRGHRASPSVPFASPRGSPIPGLTSSPSIYTANTTPTLHHTPHIRPLETPLLRGIDQLTPEEHLARGITSHELGALQKSTYHLRIAARAGLPTAMLLYALACRHGWGMRPHQAEGVMWLKKAVNSSGLEVAADESTGGICHPSTPLGPSDSAISVSSMPPDRKAHQAQLALAIYELGVSYMNGWGITQSKPLALRCFEIAGSWGDADALAEAGFCYAKGAGCKKDLKKAADLYRKAESKGISMAGNSWIYKDKYMPVPAKETKVDDGGESRSRSLKGREKEKEKEHERERDRERDKEKKTRDKSRTRTIFGRKKESAVGPAGS